MASPVRGFRAVRAARSTTENAPKPTRLTELPEANVFVMPDRIASTASVAEALLRSVVDATWLMRSALFMGEYPLRLLNAADIKAKGLPVQLFWFG